MDATQRTHLLKQKAHELGFSFVGFSQATELTDEARRLEAWLNKGYHGNMQYMENHFDKRIDPRRLVEGAKSVVSLMYNYYNPQTQTDPTAPKISMYAYNQDYHDVIKNKLKQLLANLQAELGDINGRCFVDSAPVLERDWAKHSGLGWIGKNTLLINKGHGSFYFLAELIVDVEFVYDAPIKDYCGRCTRCIDACPTQAIAPNGYIMDGSKCISYFTIELKGDLPTEMRGKFDNWAFGCDICQRVCPWNRFATPHNEPAFMPSAQLLDMTQREWHELTEDVFQNLFRKSPVKRTKYDGLRRNIQFLRD